MVQETKSEFHKKISAQLGEIEGKIAQIDVENLQSRDRSDFAEELEDLRIKLNEAEAELNALLRSSKNIWQKRRFKLEELVYDLNKTVDDALKTAQLSG